MVNLDIGPYTLLIPITLTGFALSFVFVPMATMMMATIPNKEMGNATGLANMLRNIGGSIGISMATTALIRRAALHQNEIGAQLGSSNMVLQQKAALITGLSGPASRPRAGPPRIARLGLRADGAAIGADGLCGCLPLDGGAGVFLRRGGVAVQEAGEAWAAAAGGALREHSVPRASCIISQVAIYCFHYENSPIFALYAKVADFCLQLSSLHRGYCYATGSSHIQSTPKAYARKD